MNIEYYYYMYLVILSIYFICVIEPNFTKPSVWFLYGCLVVFQILKNPLVDDGATYFRMFSNSNNIFDFINLGKEPVFSVVPVMLKSLDVFNRYTIFGVIALIGIGYKLQSFFKYSPIPILTVLIYFSFYYMELDCSGIRSGCACAIFLWSIQDIYNKKLINYLGKTLFACFFHLSILFVLPLYFFNSNKTSPNKYLIVMIVFLLLDVMNLNPIKFFLPSLSNIDRMANYVSGSEANSEVFDPLTKLYLVYMVEIYFLMLKQNVVLLINRASILLVKILFAGLIVLYVLGPVSYTLASRVSEMLTIVNCIILTYFVEMQRCVIKKFAVSILLIAYSLYVLNISTSNTGLVFRHYFG